MNFESDHLVLQYLGQVGDAAQRRLRPADRARLVERLRSQINSERERLGAHTPATVQVILDRLGKPDAVVGGELYRLGDLRNTGADEGVGAMSMRGSRYATVARQMGFRADATPIPAVVDPSRPQPAAPAPVAAPPAPPAARTSPETRPPTLAETAAGATAAPAKTAAPADPEEEPLWWRTPPEGMPDRPDPGMYDGDLVHAPAYPIGVASDTSATWEDEDSLTEPTPAMGAFGPGALRTQVREVFAIALMAIGAIVASTVVVLLGYLVVFTAAAWTLKERRFAAFYVPGATALAFAIGMWLRATGHMGADLTRDQAWDRLGELLPAMVRVAAIAASLYLLWRLNRRQVPA